MEHQGRYGIDALVQRRGIEKYTVVPIHVIPASDMDCGGGADVGTLRAWLEGMKVEYHLVSAEEATGQPKRANQHPCFYCAWRRRKALFNVAQQLGCNKLALGHNADDVAQTTLLNLFYQGKVTTMYPRVPLFGGNLIIIRPLAYAEEELLKKFALEQDFPELPRLCPADGATRRQKIKEIITRLQAEEPKANIRENIFKSLSHVKLPPDV